MGRIHIHGIRVLGRVHCRRDTGPFPGSATDQCLILTEETSGEDSADPYSRYPESEPQASMGLFNNLKEKTVERIHISYLWNPDSYPQAFTNDFQVQDEASRPSKKKSSTSKQKISPFFFFSFFLSCLAGSGSGFPSKSGSERPKHKENNRHRCCTCLKFGVY